MYILSLPVFAVWIKKWLTTYICVNIWQQTRGIYQYTVYNIYRATEILTVFKFGGLIGKKLLAEFKFGDGTSGLFIREHFPLSLKVLEQSHEFANLQEIKLTVC